MANYVCFALLSRSFDSLKLWILTIFIGLSIVTNAHAATKPKGLLCADSMGAILKDYEGLGTVHKFSELLAANPEDNLAFRYPTIAMDAFQKTWMVIDRYPSREIVDPVYGADRVREYPIFSAGVPEAQGSFIVGQRAALAQVAALIKDGAMGIKSAYKMYLLRGPAGTGKTEVLKLLNTALQTLSRENEQFFEFTYRLVNLTEIPSLQRVFGDHNGEVPDYDAPYGRSPIVLLPKELRERVTKIASEKVRKIIGTSAIPPVGADGKSVQIIEEIVKHYTKAQNGQPLTVEQFIEKMNKHVEIVRRNRPPPTGSEQQGLIRYLGQDPAWDQLAFQRNISASDQLGPSNPLSHHYNGLLMKADGGVMTFDEFFRNEHSVRDVTLEIIQNRVVSHSGVNASVDAVVMGASNDASIEDASKKGSTAAHLSRTIQIPMRLLLPPLEIAKTLFFERGTRNFKMRALDDPNASIEPLDIMKVYPNATESGKLVGPDGRYAIYEDIGDGQQVLIAPRSLELIALTAAATRLVTDTNKLKEFGKEFDLLEGKGGGHFRSVVDRLQIINRELDTEYGIREELSRASKILKEGETGIEERDASTWLTVALQMARENQNTLTPALVSEAFKRILSDRKFNVKDEMRGRYIELHQTILENFTLSSLGNDIRRIISGDGDRIKQIYDEVKQEILAIGRDREADKFELRSGERMPINFTRYKEISGIYRELHGRELVAGDISSFHLSNTSETDVHRPLMLAIETWLVEKEIDTKGVSGLLQYFTGRDTDRKTAELGRSIRNSFERLGYNERSFTEALKLFYDLRYEKQRKKKEPKQ